MKTSSDYRRPGKALKLAQTLGLVNKRNMFWSWYEPRNFGDWIGPYLFEKITGNPPLFCDPKTLLVSGKTYFCAGSILRKITKPDTSIVWGSGIISREDQFERPLEITAVRGPFSRERCLELGYDCPEVYGDPAILMPLLYKPKATFDSDKVGLIPHFRDLEAVKEMMKGRDDLSLVDVTLPVEQVIDQIVSCKYTISSSLHGIILSHAYGVATSWVEFSDTIFGDGVKYLDHFCCAGDDVEVAPVFLETLPEKGRLIDLAETAHFPNLTPVQERLFAACPFGSIELDERSA